MDSKGNIRFLQPGENPKPDEVELTPEEYRKLMFLDQDERRNFYELKRAKIKAMELARRTAVRRRRNKAARKDRKNRR